MPDRATLENALVAFVRRYLPGGSTAIWARQGAARPEGTYAELSLDSLTSLGLEPERTVTDNPTPLAGAEIIETLHDHGERLLTLRCFAGRNTTGNNSAPAILERIGRATALSAEVAVLADAGVAVVDVGTVQDLTGLLDTVFESQAQLDVRIRTLDTLSATTTFIETVVTPGTYS